jgi:hypothetical protein
MASVIYNSFKKKIMDGSIDLDNDTIKVMLVSSSYTPDQDSHNFINDVSSYEISGAGYTAGGAVLANKSVTQDNTNDCGVFDADDVVWTSSTITARGAVLYKDTGNPSTSPLICYIDFGSDKSSSGANFTIQWSSSGILKLA